MRRAALFTIAMPRGRPGPRRRGRHTKTLRGWRFGAGRRETEQRGHRVLRGARRSRRGRRRRELRSRPCLRAARSRERGAAGRPRARRARFRGGHRADARSRAFAADASVAVSAVRSEVSQRENREGSLAVDVDKRTFPVALAHARARSEDRVDRDRDRVLARPRSGALRSLARDRHARARRRSNRDRRLGSDDAPRRRSRSLRPQRPPRPP